MQGQVTQCDSHSHSVTQCDSHCKFGVSDAYFVQNSSSSYILAFSLKVGNSDMLKSITLRVKVDTLVTRK